MPGCLLIHIGIDLTREALWDSIGAFDAIEYASIVAITVVSGWVCFDVKWCEIMFVMLIPVMDVFAILNCICTISQVYTRTYFTQ